MRRMTGRRKQYLRETKQSGWFLITSGVGLSHSQEKYNMMTDFLSNNVKRYQYCITPLSNTTILIYHATCYVHASQKQDLCSFDVLKKVLNDMKTLKVRLSMTPLLKKNKAYCLPASYCTIRHTDLETLVKQWYNIPSLLAVSTLFCSMNGNFRPGGCARRAAQPAAALREKVASLPGCITDDNWYPGGSLICFPICSLLRNRRAFHAPT